MKRPARRLQRRLMFAFATFALLTAAVFGLYAMVFMYAVEDEFFEAMLDQEVAAQLRHLAETGAWATPRDASMTMHVDIATFPDDLRASYTSEPRRHEFPGRAARHYHLRQIDPPAPSARAWLVAEVSGQLVVRPMRDRILVLLAGSGLLIVAGALLVGYWLARRTTGPLSRLAERVDRMSPDHLGDDVAQGFRDDEVGILARGLEALAVRIRAFIAREQAFTRDASHELRTPLAVIRSAVERLMTEPQLSEPGRAHLHHVRQSLAQLEQTVTSLLTLAREQHGARTDECVTVLPVLERVIVEQSALLEGKPVAVEVEIVPSLRMRMPEPALHILLSNLIGNAFAHTAGGEVRIDVADGRLRIANSADGGDPAARWQQPQAFSKRAGSDGYGLGLTIVHRLCDVYAIDLCIDDARGLVVASIALDRMDAALRTPEADDA